MYCNSAIFYLIQHVYKLKKIWIRIQTGQKRQNDCFVNKKIKDIAEMHHIPIPQSYSE